MISIKYCEVCGKETDTKIIASGETYNVCGESIEVNARVLVCAVCGEAFYCEEFDNATLVCAYNEYRRRHGLLFPDEIKKIRKQYKISQLNFSRLLNWQDKTICRYENGSIQNELHNRLLLSLREPKQLRTYLAETNAKIMLTEQEKSCLLETLDKLEEDACKDYS